VLVGLFAHTRARVHTQIQSFGYVHTHKHARTHTHTHTHTHTLLTAHAGTRSLTQRSQATRASYSCGPDGCLPVHKQKCVTTYAVPCKSLLSITVVCVCVCAGCLLIDAGTRPTRGARDQASKSLTAMIYVVVLRPPSFSPSRLSVSAGLPRVLAALMEV
jgi:hypothetical protein